MIDSLWGPIAIENWRDTPSIAGRVDREEDLVAGRAVYFLKDPEMINAHALGVTRVGVADGDLRPFEVGFKLADFTFQCSSRTGLSKRFSSSAMISAKGKPAYAS